MTLYAFSTENWKRSQDEVSYIMKLPAIFFKKYMKEFIDRGFRMEIIGELDPLPKSTKQVLLEAEEESKRNEGLHLSICMNYGGQSETVIAAKRYAQALRKNPNLELTIENFHEYLLTKNLPPVDLMIRTSGEQRISNYLPWQLAYAEFRFVQESWPEFSEDVLKRCMEEYVHRDRRFGGVKE